MKWTGVAVVPLAAISTGAAADSGLELRSRIVELEDVEAIRDLHMRLVRQFNAGTLDSRAREMFAAAPQLELADTVRRLDPATDGDAIEVVRAADGLSATARSRHLIRSETSLNPDCAIAEMAIAQGDGMIRSCETGWLVNTLLKQDDDKWKVKEARLMIKSPG